MSTSQLTPTRYVDNKLLMFGRVAKHIRRKLETFEEAGYKTHATGALSHPRPLGPGLKGLAFCACLIGAGCASAVRDAEPGRWVRVLRDANYTVAIDTGRVTRHWDRSWQVWYRTEHAVPRLHKGKEFNREVVQSRVHCDSLTFKVVSVDMSMDGGPPISVQRMDAKELDDQPWRRVKRGTAEEIAAKAACHFAAERIRAGSRRRTRD